MAPGVHTHGRLRPGWNASWAVLLLLVVIVAAPCSSSPVAAIPPLASQTSTSPGPKTLRLASSYEFATSWDPQASAYAESAYLRNMYDGLLIENPTGSAEQYSRSWRPRGPRTRTARSGRSRCARASSSATARRSTPQAVKYSFDSTKKLGQGAAYILDFIDKVIVVDDYTVKFTAKTPTPFDRLLSATDATYIFSPATKGMKPDDWTGKSFGTGPYMIQELQAG